MKKKEIAEAMLELGARCHAVKEARAVGTGEHKGTDIDLTMMFQAAAEAFGVAYLAITGELDEDDLEPSHVLAAMAEHYLTILDGGEGHE